MAFVTQDEDTIFKRSDGASALSRAQDQDEASLEQLKKDREASILLRRKQQTRKIRGKSSSYTAPSTKAKGSSSSSFALSSGRGSFASSTKGLSALPAFASTKTLEESAVTTDVQPPEQGWGMKTLDFLFGAEAAILGIAHDSDGFSWNMENARQQWSEHPLWSNLLSLTSLVGTMVVPAGLAVKSSMKFGMLASKVGALALEAKEIETWQKAGMIGLNIKKYNDLGDGFVESKKVVKMLRQNQVSLEKFGKMEARAKRAQAGELSMKLTPLDSAKHHFEKRFSSTYNRLISPTAEGAAAREGYHASLNNLWKSDTLGTLLTTMPEEVAGPKMYAYMLGRLNPSLAPRAAKDFGKLSATEKKFADFHVEALKKQQTTAHNIGLISDDEFKRIGEFHLPAQNLGTPETSLENVRGYLIPISAKAAQRKVKTRTTGLVETTEPRTGFGKLFGKEKTVIKATGETEYVPVHLATMPRTDFTTLLTRKKSHDQIYDSLKSGKLITSPHQVTVNGFMQNGLIRTNFETIRDLAVDSKYFASADDIAAWGGSAAKAGEAGFVNLANGGAEFSVRMKRMIAKVTGQPETDLPWLRKDIYDEIFGASGMMEQARMAGGDMLEAATTIFKTMKTAGNPATHLQNFVGNMTFLSQAGFNVTSPRNIVLMTKMTEIFGKMAKVKAAAKKAGLDSSLQGEASVMKRINYGKWKVGNRELDLTEEFSHPVIRELIEESSFEAIEGSGNLLNIERKLGVDQYATRGLIRAYKSGKTFVQGGDRVKWFDTLTKAYLAEDMVPKMAYYIHLRGQGLTQKASAMEVARRLPMYNTVGSAIKRGRKYFAPWATFPAEAMRITKNNMIDHPLRMIPWLRAPQIAQAMVSGVGLGPETRGAVSEAERQLPTWAQKGTTVVAEGGALATAGGALTGGLIGGAIGAAVTKGAGGAAVGAAAGAAFAATLAAINSDEINDKQMRGAILDFLPHSTFMLTSTSVDFGGNILPFKDLRGAVEQSPAEPFAILKPMVDIWSGETAYGTPVGDGTTEGMLAKTVAGAIGFLMPPLIEKYVLKTTTPQVEFPGDPTGITNVSRLQIDTGNAIDQMTGLPGNFGHDFFLNNIGIWKSYVATGEQQLSNESLTERHMGTVRSNLTRNLAFHLENGNDDETVDILSEVQGTFAQQFLHDPRLAQLKYSEWLERRHQTIGRHPKLRNWSEEELLSRLRLAGHAAGEARMRARSLLLQTLRDELRVRGGGGGTRAGSTGAGSTRAGG